MTEKKKIFLAPEMKVVVLDQADIIATSGSQGQIQSLEDNDDYEGLF